MNQIKTTHELENEKTVHSQTALRFATALVNEFFDDAYILLSSTLCDEWSPELLRKTYEEMVEYFHVPPNWISVDIVDTESLGAEFQDGGWVYVSIACDSGVEAVTVIISVENGKYVIQEIEWGRP
jgi:hypothetical protein